MTHEHSEDRAGKEAQAAGNSRAPETRLDPAHPKQSAEATPTGPALLQPRPVRAAAHAATGESPAPSPEGLANSDPSPLETQIELHAAQLGDHLSRRQEDLDRQEKELKERDEAIHIQLRSVQGYINQRDRQLDEREAALDVRAKAIDQAERRLKEDATGGRAKPPSGIKVTPQRRDPGNVSDPAKATGPEAPHYIELAKLKEAIRRREIQMEQRLAGVRGQEAELARRAERIDRRAKEIAESEQRIAERHEQIQLALKRYERVGLSHERLHQIEQQEAEQAARNRYLDDAEALLEQDHQELAAARQQVERDREAQQRAILEEREAMSREVAAAKADLDQERTSLQQQTAELQRREKIAARLRDQLIAIQKSTLEMRLVVEELWAKVSHHTTPAQVTQNLAQIRRQLAAQHQLELDELGRRRAELEALAAQIEEGQQKLDERREEFERWMTAKTHQIEADAERHVAREEELIERQADYAHAERDWTERDAQRRAEIRRLLAQLRQDDSQRAA